MATGSDDPRKSSRQSFLRQFAFAVDLPFVLVAGVVLGGGIGYLLDRVLHTAPLCTLVLGLLGFAGGVWEVLRLIRAGKKND